MSALGAPTSIVLAPVTGSDLLWPDVNVWLNTLLPVDDFTVTQHAPVVAVRVSV